MFVFDILQIPGAYSQIFNKCSASTCTPWLQVCCYLASSFYLDHKIPLIQNAHDRQVVNYQIFWITRQYLYWLKFWQVIFCYCSYTSALSLSVPLKCPPHFRLMLQTFIIGPSISLYHTQLTFQHWMKP
jgi:hypothetical protein